MVFYISSVLAEEVKQGSISDMLQQSNLSSLLPFLLIFLIFYFILIRPQVKKQKEHVAMLDSLKKGEKIITTGGIIGSVVKLEDNIVYIEIAPEVKIKVVKSSITEIVNNEKDDKTAKEKMKEKKEIERSE